MNSTPRIEVTVWEARVGDEWRYCDPETAALVEASRPGCIRLVSRLTPPTLAFDRQRRSIKDRPGITPRRIAAAKRALSKEVEAAGLFGYLLAPTQPTPEERCHQFDVAIEENSRDRRKKAAEGWWECRRLLRQFPPEARAMAMFNWGVKWQPKEPFWCLEFLRREFAKVSTFRRVALPILKTAA